MKITLSVKTILSVVKLQETDENIVFEIEYKKKNIFGRTRYLTRKAFLVKPYFMWRWLDNGSFIKELKWNKSLNAISQMNIKGRYFL